jgi:signal transduction histidine kinase
VVHVQLEAALTLLAREPERARNAVLTAQQLTQQGLNEVRRSVSLLRAESARQADLIDALHRLVRDASLADTRASMRVEGTPRRIAEPLEFTLFRAAQEGLTNAHRHARARHVQVVLAFSADEVALRVHDDGAGNHQPRAGFGLTGLCERAELVGGTLRFGSRAQGGFELALTVPA